MVQGWHPDRSENDTLTTVLEPYLAEDTWREIIPLAAVLGSKATELLLARMAERLKLSNVPKEETSIGTALANCLADEAPARPDTIRASLKELVKKWNSVDGRASANLLFQSKYGPDFREEAGRAFLSGKPDLLNPGRALLAICGSRYSDKSQPRDEYIEYLFRSIGSDDQLSRCEGALGLGQLWELTNVDGKRDAGTAITEFVEKGSGDLLKMIFVESQGENVAACYALEGLISLGAWLPPLEVNYFGRLFELWQESTDSTLRTHAVRAIIAPSLNRQFEKQIAENISLDKLESVLLRLGSQNDQETPAALVLAWYLRALPESKLNKLASEIKPPLAEFKTIKELIRLTLPLSQ